MSAALRSGHLSQICCRLVRLEISSGRPFHTTSSRNAESSSTEPTPEEKAKAASRKQADTLKRMSGSIKSKPETMKMTPAERAAAAAKRSRDELQKQQAGGAINSGGLASDSIFADESTAQTQQDETKIDQTPSSVLELSERNHAHMERALNPRPNARARWHRKMIIRQIRRGGRLTKEMKIARTERNHLSKSHFFKTSMKKLAPLARQISGKSLDEAILQMRFSNKQVALEVKEHLVQARNEAVAIKGMGLNHTATSQFTHGAIVNDPSSTAPEPAQTTVKTRRTGGQPDETNIYVAQAWVNRGPYGKQPEYRARGRMNVLRPPHTGLSVLLKEEKTRTREKIEKEDKAIRKRMGKNMWTQLPDRPITNQLQHVLW